MSKLTKSDVERLLADTAFGDILESIRTEQVQIFIKSAASDTEAREDAHSIIRALDKIEQALKSVMTEEAIKEKRNKGRS